MDKCEIIVIRLCSAPPSLSPLLALSLRRGRRKRHSSTAHNFCTRHPVEEDRLTAFASSYEKESGRERQDTGQQKSPIE
jgi:hypothetical protein